MKLPMRLLLSATLLLGTACALEPLPVDPPRPVRAQFDREVYPVLLRDCGFPECHGALTAEEARFFRVYGPGRSRLGFDDGDDPRLPATDEERDHAYERSRSMLAGAASAEETLLVRKPLAVSAGGAPHMGLGEMGNDVYQSTDDPGYQALLDWAATGTYRGAE